MKKIIVLGTGGNCIDIVDTINEINLIKKTYQCVGFLDDDLNKKGKSFCGIRVLGRLEDAYKYSDCYFVNGIGSTSNFWFKKDIIDKTGVGLDRFETIIHPAASVSRMAEIGRGVVVLQNCTISSRVYIGNHVIILPNTVVNHESYVDDYTIIASGVCISGNVRIGSSCYLGSNCSIKNDVNIGKDVLIGMGSTVLKDIDSNQVVVGSPAEFLRHSH